jgi:hypothetical protein
MSSPATSSSKKPTKSPEERKKLDERNAKKLEWYKLRKERKEKREIEEANVSPPLDDVDDDEEEEDDIVKLLKMKLKVSSANNEKYKSKYINLLMRLQDEVTK